MAADTHSKTQSKDFQRVTISLPAEAWEFLKDEARRSGVSMADVLRRSVATEKFIQNQRRAGADVLIHPKGSNQASKLVFKD